MRFGSQPPLFRCDNVNILLLMRESANVNGLLEGHFLIFEWFMSICYFKYVVIERYE